MLIECRLGVSMSLNEDGSYAIRVIKASGATTTDTDGEWSCIDDEGWELRPGYRLSVSMDIEHAGPTGLAVSYSRKRVRRKFRPTPPTVEDGTSSDWEDPE